LAVSPKDPDRHHFYVALAADYPAVNNALCLSPERANP